ncbi:MAG: EpsG family protein [Candidatus Electronema sp. V4]|uniref:EpsG family protein n=1 Tax=Candidatus Electronema sp. V4 TaxID=3454756 RepID=UPI004055920B
MIPYIVYYIATIFLLLFSEKTKSNIFYIIAIILSILFSGLRDDVGYDYKNYMSFYMYPETIPDEIEPLFKLSVYIFNFLTLDYHYFFLAYSAMTLCFVVLAIKQISLHQKTSFLIFLTVPSFYLTSFSIIRFSLALAIYFYALTNFLTRKKYNIFILLTMLSIGFHYTLFFVFIMTLIMLKIDLKRRISKGMHILLLITSYIIYFYQIPSVFLSKFLFGKYSYYSEFMGESTSLKIFAISIFYIYLSFNLVKIKNDTIVTLTNILLFSILLTISFYEYPHIGRLMYTFSILQIIVVPVFLHVKNLHPYMKLFTRTGLLFYYLSMPAMVLLADLTCDIDSKFIPYKNLFFN